jgi:hypothetical protein
MATKLKPIPTGNGLSHYEVMVDGLKVGEVYQVEHVKTSGTKRITLRKYRAWRSADTRGVRQRHDKRKDAVDFLEKQPKITQ